MSVSKSTARTVAVIRSRRRVVADRCLTLTVVRVGGDVCRATDRRRVSTTVTVNEQLAELLAASLTEQLTVIVPFAKSERLPAHSSASRHPDSYRKPSERCS
jgi:hypothetical protein